MNVEILIKNKHIYLSTRNQQTLISLKSNSNYPKIHKFTAVNVRKAGLAVVHYPFGSPTLIYSLALRLPVMFSYRIMSHPPVL